MRKTFIAILALILISFIIGISLWSIMPNMMASHWNASGQVDDYMSKFWGLFLFPFILVFFLILYHFIPRIDPLKKNIEKFRKYFDWFIFLIALFFLYIYILTLFFNLNYQINMTFAIIHSIAFLFFFIGILIQNAKRNWFVGIRTPWTLSSDIVWNKTHKIGGKLFKISAIITLIGLFFGKYAIWFLLISILASVIYLLFYSYFEYKKLENKKRKR